MTIFCLGYMNVKTWSNWKWLQNLELIVTDKQKNRKKTDLSLHNYLFLCKECFYFCLASSRNLKVLQTFDYFYHWLTKFLIIKLMREPYDFIHHFQGVRRGLDLFRIFDLFIYVFIAWYIHNLISWVFMFFNGLFSNFLTPENAVRIYCCHRGSIFVSLSRST